MRHGERGTSMVEFAIATTALLLFMFGILEYGRLLYVYHTVSNAARLGSRWAMVRGAGCDTLDHCQATSDDVQTYVRSQIWALMDPNQVTVTASWPGGNSTCPANQTNKRGCLVQVTVTYPFTFAVSWLGGQIPVSSSSQMIIAN